METQDLVGGEDGRILLVEPYLPSAVAVAAIHLRGQGLKGLVQRRQGVRRKGPRPITHRDPESVRRRPGDRVVLGGKERFGVEGSRRHKETAGTVRRMQPLFRSNVNKQSFCAAAPPCKGYEKPERASA